MVMKIICQTFQLKRKPNSNCNPRPWACQVTDFRELSQLMNNFRRSQFSETGAMQTETHGGIATGRTSDPAPQDRHTRPKRRPLPLV